MAAIQPASQIVLYENVPFDNTYTDTLYSENVQEQINWFNQYAHHTFNALSYQRHTRNTCRVQATADDLYNVNYMIFSNPSYGTKRFFAFVTAVEYINNITTEITYEIDVMQTYFHDYTLEPCFVEREHTSDDTIGHNIATEPVDLGPIKCTDKEIPYDWFENLSVVVCHANNEAADASGDSGDQGGLTITKQPKSYSVQSDSTQVITLTCVAKSSGQVVNYQWEIYTKSSNSWTVINGATGSSYNVATSVIEDGGYREYRCHVTDTGGGSVYSRVSTVQKATAFRFTKQPISTNVWIDGAEATAKADFTLECDFTGGTGSYEVNWRERRRNDSNNTYSSWSKVAKSAYSVDGGQTILKGYITAPVVQQGISYQYQCVVNTKGLTGDQSYVDQYKSNIATIVGNIR